MRDIIETHHLKPMAIRSAYYMAYPEARKVGWWDKARSKGPIVEQASHFADLSRFIGGEVDLSSLHAHTVEHNEQPGHLSQIGVDESQIPPEHRVPRFTSVIWKFNSGAVGSLSHAIALHGTEYETEFEVIADGWHLRLFDPYGLPTLHIKQPGVKGITTEQYSYETHDPFLEEISVFIDAVESGDTSSILSSYEDAVMTFDLVRGFKPSHRKID